VAPAVLAAHFARLPDERAYCGLPPSHAEFTECGHPQPRATGVQRLRAAVARTPGQLLPVAGRPFGMNERGAHFWPTAMFTGGVFGSQHSQHSQQPYSGQYSQQRDVGLQPAVPAAVGSSFFGLQYSEQPCSGQQPTVVTAEVVGSFPGQHSEQRFAHFDFGQQPLHEQGVQRLETAAVAAEWSHGVQRLETAAVAARARGIRRLRRPAGTAAQARGAQQPPRAARSVLDQPCSGQQQTVVTAAATYSLGLGQQPPSDGELQEQPAGFGQPTVVKAGFPSGSSIRSSRAFRSRRRRQQQPWRASADCSASGKPRRQLRIGAFAGGTTGMRREEEMW
jgi:hypothetical protein